MGISPWKWASSPSCPPLNVLPDFSFILSLRMGPGYHVTVFPFSLDTKIWSFGIIWGCRPGIGKLRSAGQIQPSAYFWKYKALLEPSQPHPYLYVLPVASFAVFFYYSMNLITFMVVQWSSQPNFIVFPSQPPHPPACLLWKPYVFQSLWVCTCSAKKFVVSFFFRCHM